MKTKFFAAAAAALLAAGSAQAGIVTFSTPISVPNTADGVYINLVTGATGSTGGSVTGWDFNPYNSGSGLSFFWAPAPAGGVATAAAGGQYINLAPGAIVSAASTLTRITALAATVQFQTVGTHILGFAFLNEGTGATNYGYMTVTNGAAAGFPMTITGWSYENTGAAITVAGATAPAVPEPASWAMMIGGLGLVGAAMRRKSATIAFA